MTGAAVTAAAVERRKITASAVVVTTSVLLVVGITVIAGAMTAAADAGNDQVLAQLGELADATGWDRLTGVVAQVSAAGAVLGFGTGLAWMFGREFADGTVAGLFALPISRRSLVLGKLAVYAVWAVAIAVTLVVVLGMVGLALGFGAPDTHALAAMARQFALTVLSAAIAVPAAWAATLGRGILPGIATVVGIVATAQVMAIAGIGAWFPVAAPALWALSPEEVSATQLGLVAIVPVGFGILTAIAWDRLQLDR